jgi:AcrR family transcriptional regulator
VPSPRSYRSPRRELDAATTRSDIFDAARELFVANGYARVTVADIARQANVAAKTVYASAGSKADILNELIANAVEGSGAQDTLEAVRRSRDFHEVIELVAGGTRAGNEANRDAIDIMYAAMSVHDDAETLWKNGTTMYRAVLRDTAVHLEEIGALADGVDVDRAADILWFCFGTQAWRTLVKDCGWTWADAEQWLAAQAATMLGGAQSAS